MTAMGIYVTTLIIQPAVPAKAGIQLPFVRKTKYNLFMRERILSEIKRIAQANDGEPPGAIVFKNNTGIREHDWLGVFWARWSDALIEAGFQPKQFNSKADSQIYLRKIVEAIRHFRKFPTSRELMLYKNIDEEFPAPNTLRSHFGIGSGMSDAVREWIEKNPPYTELLDLLPKSQKPSNVISKTNADGFVYLIKSGQFYKIGRGDELEKRVKQIRTALPDASTLEHSIRTDDPSGIEAYWHRRFADKRANGEWFKLTIQDVAAFKKRKFQ
jgi:Meiotically up-regulated gene 113